MARPRNPTRSLDVQVSNAKKRIATLRARIEALQERQDTENSMLARLTAAIDAVLLAESGRAESHVRAVRAIRRKLVKTYYLCRPLVEANALVAEARAAYAAAIRTSGNSDSKDARTCKRQLCKAEFYVAEHWKKELLALNPEQTIERDRIQAAQLVTEAKRARMQSCMPGTDLDPRVSAARNAGADAVTLARIELECARERAVAFSLGLLG